ncbi:MAG: hypothetical protein WBZ42_04755 [Halobacteriota archaeon]
MESGYYVGPKSHAEFLKDDAVYEALSQKLVDVLGSELKGKEDDRSAAKHTSLL